MHLTLSIFGQQPVWAPGAQVWKGGATDLGPRTMIPAPPRWLGLADDARDPGPEPAPLLHWDMEQITPGDRASPDTGGGVILVSMNVDPAHEDEFNDWYDTEHIPHFNRLPGVIAARRFRAIRGDPRYVALYHVQTTDIYATPAWMAANETPWILRMRRFQRDRTYFMFRQRIV